MSKQKDITELWISFSADRGIDSKHKIITHYIWLVKYVLQQTSLPTNTILNEDDFLSIGILGLNESIERFDPERGVKFETYAIPRIKGIIQDELRKLDWLSRTARKKAHEFIQAKDILRKEEGREVSSEEIMNKLGVTPEKYQTYLAAAAAAKSSLSLNDSQIHGFDDDDETDIIEELPDNDAEDYLSKIENDERINFLTTYLNRLADKKRLVMTLYYYENLTFKEIGQVVNVSESRICQIHTQVVNDLRIRLKEFDNA